MRASRLVWILPIVVPFLTALSQGGPSDGLVGHWRFDEHDGQGCKDASPAGNHGSLHGAARARGKAGGAIECGQDRFVEVPHSKSLDDLSRGVTVCAWVNRADDATWNTVVSREIAGGPSEYFGLAVMKGKPLFSIDPDGKHYQNVKGDADVPAGQWVHLAGTYDNETFRLFVNGREVKSAKGAGPLRIADENPLLIGANTNSQGRTWVDCFHGLIDEVRIYDHALTPAEVAVVYGEKG